MTNEGQTKNPALSPRDEVVLKTLRSFSTRWSILSPILAENLSQQRTADRVTLAQAKLTKMYFRSATKSLGGVEEEVRNGLVADIATADAAFLAELLEKNPVTLTLERAREAMETRLLLPASPPAESELASKEATADEPLSEEEKQFYLPIMAAFALDRVQQCLKDEQTFDSSDLLPKMVRAISPNMKRKEVARFALFMKETAGGKRLPSDWDDDIPF